MRRLWLLLMVAMVVFPAVAAAQTEPVGTVSTGDDEVYRAYDNTDGYFDVMSGVMTFGSVYGSAESASRSLATTPEIFVASLQGGVADDESAGNDFTFGELEEIDQPQIGDESRVARLPLTLYDAFDGEYGIVVVRQDTWVQVLLGFGFGDVDVVTELTGIATSIVDRWPSDDPVAVREDGLRTGGIWDMTPRPEDLDAGFEVDPEFEEGPPATIDAVVPVGPREDAATPVAAEATTAPDRNTRLIPLIPVETPAGPPDADAPATIVPNDLAPATEAPVTEPAVEPTEAVPATVAVPVTEQTAEPPVATEVVPAVVATPAMNARLAQPFDATVEIILAQEHYERSGTDGSCAGAGLLEALGAGGELVLREQDGETMATTTIDAPGVITYDTVLKQDVCYLTAQFSDVPARAGYVLVASDSVIARLSYDDLAAGEPVLVVIGADEP